MSANKQQQGSSMKRRTQNIVSETTEIIEPGGGEGQKVESWRLHVLMEAGYPLPLAEKLAGSEADLHRAVELGRRRSDGAAAERALAVGVLHAQGSSRRRMRGCDDRALALRRAAT